MKLTFKFSDKEAIEIAYIIARNQDNHRFLRKLLLQAIVYERLLTHIKPAP